MYYKRLKELRENQKMTQLQFSEKIGIDRGTYSHYETEHEPLPIKHLINICNYFNVSLDYLFNFTNQKKYKNTKSEINKTLSGERLKKLRKEHHLTQAQFSKIWNISDTAISAYEKAKHTISTPFLYHVCDKYQISADYLLGRTDEPIYLNEK